MNLTRDRLQSLGWVSLLAICGALTLGLALHVNAVKSEVYRTRQQVVSLSRDIDMLEVEFATRSNQHQLKTINDLEFGYTAPRADQYIEGERQLASLGIPRSPDAPQPILMAEAVTGDREDAPAQMVSPITGKPNDAARSQDEDAASLRKDAARLGQRLAKVDFTGAAENR